MGLIVYIINFLFAVYYLLILARVVLPFVPHQRHHPLIKPVYDLTDPVLVPVRQGLPPGRIGFDASPFIVILLLALLQRIILYLIGGW